MEGSESDECYRKTNIDIFGKVGQQILEWEIQSETAGEGQFLQIRENKLVDDFYNKVVDIDSRVELHPETVNCQKCYWKNKRRYQNAWKNRLK